jgi:hypothetical protein
MKHLLFILNTVMFIVCTATMLQSKNTACVPEYYIVYERIEDKKEEKKVVEGYNYPLRIGSMFIMRKN